MPRLRKNVRKGGLTEVEKEEFESVGYDEKEIARFEKELQLETWDFWSKASELFITLRGAQETTFVSGKVRTQDISTSAKFSSNYFHTADRETARLIFLSDHYHTGRIMLAKDQVEKEAQDAYNEFRTKVLSSPKNVERLKKDLVTIGA